MYRPKQLSFPGYPKSKTAFGGSLNEGKRKTARPLCEKRSVHLVLRSEVAKGKWNFLERQNAKLIWKLAKEYGKRFDVKIYDFANVGNHLHLLIKAKSKSGLRNFLRVYAGQVAQRITRAKPGSKLQARFWNFIVFSRIIEWGKAYTIAKLYILKNVFQACRIVKGYPILS